MIITRSRGRAAVSILAALCSATALAAVVATAPAGADAQHSWVAARPVCAQPATPGTPRCFAEKLVSVSAHTPGAIPSADAAVGHGPGGGLSPADLAKFYGYNPQAKVDITVGIVIWGNHPLVRSDLNHFDSHYGLPRETATSFRVVNQNGASSPLPRNNPDTYPEIALDTQAVRAVCNRCRILLVEAAVDGSGNPSEAGLAAAENTAVRLGATVVSNSWGGPEAGTGSTLQRAFKHPGVVITAATGDDGWNGWDFAAQGQRADNMASFPAVSPYVVAVGGTTITPRADGTRANEVVWNSDGTPQGSTSDNAAAGATGGGCSRYQPARGWQSHAPDYSANGCGGKRLGIDISVDANPATGLSVWDSGWGRYGGTSLSAPIVAGMYALAGGSGGSAYPAASLYVNADTLGRSSSLFDVVSGGNSFCGGTSPQSCADAVRAGTSVLGIGGTNNPNQVYPGSVVDCSFPRSGTTVTPPTVAGRQCNAARGLDGASGLGAPRGLGLFRDTSPSASISRPSRITHGRSTTYRAVLHPVKGARIVTVQWSWGDGSKGSSGTAARHTFRRAGTYRVTMSAGDSLYQVVVRHTTVRVR